MGVVPVPLRVVNAVAPIRICDIGGWTDTWFARHGKVFNIGVDPGVEVQVEVHPDGALVDRIVLVAENYGDRYGFESGSRPGRHPLLEAAVEEIGIPDGVSVEISVFSEVPVGCSTGTSASATVAIVGALAALSPHRMGPDEIACTAHRIEVERLGAQSGIQDQLCAAYGGINYIDMPSYPRASVVQLHLPETVWWELEQRLLLVFLGRAHVSSEMHERVIARLTCRAECSGVLEDLRRAAERAKDAVQAADFTALGQALMDNTEAQRRLHPDLVSGQAQIVFDVATAHGALGYKVNGAGGEGGSVTVLCGGDMRVKRALVRALGETGQSFEVIPIRLSRQGLRVWEP